MRDTSLEAYASIMERLPDSRKAVYEVICRWAMKGQALSDKDIASQLSWTINRVTPRRGELEKSKCIVSSGYVHIDGKKMHTWLPTGEFYEAKKRESKSEYWHRLYDDEKAKVARLEEIIKGLRPKDYDDKQGEFWK